MSDFLTKLKTDLMRDWRRTGILGLLVVVGAVLLIRQFASGPGPAKAKDYKAPAQKEQTGTAPAPVKPKKIGPAAQAVIAAKTPDTPTDKVFRFSSDVSAMSLPRRDPFKARLDSFPPDPNAFKPDKEVKITQPADPEVERQRRLAQEAILRAEAQKLQLQSILITDPPQAMIGGDIYRAGQQIGPFMLTRVGANSVTLEKDGFEVMLKME
jgi:hypothetical protein